MLYFSHTIKTEFKIYSKNNKNKVKSFEYAFSREDKSTGNSKFISFNNLKYYICDDDNIKFGIFLKAV